MPRPPGVDVLWLRATMTGLLLTGRQRLSRHLRQTTTGDTGKVALETFLFTNCILVIIGCAVVVLASLNSR